MFWAAIFFVENMASNFEKKVLQGLNDSLSLCGVTLDGVDALGVAVSGGADSISLLYALKKILPEGKVLKAVTVNHNIRSLEETCGDADFVEETCRSIGVCCRRYEIPRGLILDLAKNDGLSIEDLARKIRYERFRDFIRNEHVDFLCLAHNRNDQIETVFMRMIQGSSDLSGIPMARERYLRPLLKISRKEIEDYLDENSLRYRTDSTNSDDSMLRNKIRNRLVPFMDENFSGWQKGFDSISEKSFYDNKAIDALVHDSIEKIGCVEGDQGVTFDGGIFFSLPEAVKTRILMEFVMKLGAERRMPYSFIKRWCSASYCRNKKFESSCGIELSFRDGRFSIAKKNRVATEEGFFAIIEEDGIFNVGDMDLCVKKSCGGLLLSADGISLELEGLDYPIAVRSRQSGDVVECGDGSFRSVSKILDNWKAKSLRDRIPLVQKIDGSLCGIKCIWGEVCGFENWIVSRM